MSAFFRSGEDPHTGGADDKHCCLKRASPAAGGSGAVPGRRTYRTDVVCPTCTGNIMAGFTRVGTGAEDAVRPAYLLRLRRTDLSAFWTFCREMNLPVSPIVIGQAFATGTCRS